MEICREKAEGSSRERSAVSMVELLMTYLRVVGAESRLKSWTQPAAFTKLSRSLPRPRVSGNTR